MERGAIEGLGVSECLVAKINIYHTDVWNFQGINKGASRYNNLFLIPTFVPFVYRSAFV